MSAFFVSYGTVDDVVAAFLEIEHQPLDPDTFGRELLRMNAEAMRQRYPQIVNEVWSDEDLRPEYQVYLAEADAYRFQKASENPRQRAKSCACLMYQCSEGDVPTTDLYKRLVAVREAMQTGHPWNSIERLPDGRLIHRDLEDLTWDRPRESEGVVT